ncbi:hypothetical protein EVG20_g8675 [Dentipellis fragilis]|uniref:Uncharacterized protein n=1 Tax=Dentipellis fragilis TaxID=205917 RepID=A0A4Y9Y5M0_9AGAM|nr:hypothetical protein EVG20_g8675 [Dentipellis fragilis]
MSESPIPALNTDCTSLILNYLNNFTLKELALTSHAAATPVRKQLVRCLYFTNFETAITGFTFVWNHSLLPNVRTIVFDVNEETWSSPFAILVVNFISSAPALNGFLAKGFAALFDACPRIIDVLAAKTPVLSHLHLHGLTHQALQALRGIHGLHSIALNVQELHFAADSAKHIAAIISNNAETLREVSIHGPPLGMRLWLDRDAPPCLLVSHLALHHLAFCPEEVSRMFPNIQQQNLWNTSILTLEEKRIHDPAVFTWPPETVRVLFPVAWFNDFASLRSLVIKTFVLGFHVGDLIALLRRSRLRDLSLSQVSIGKHNRWYVPSDSEATASPLLSDIISNASGLRRLDVKFDFVIPYDPIFVVPHPTFRASEMTSELTYLSLSIQLSAEGALVDRDLCLAIVKPWFQSLPTLVHMRLAIGLIETRWERRWTTSSTSGALRSLVVPYDMRGDYTRTSGPDDEDAVFSVKNSDGYSLTAWCDDGGEGTRWPQEHVEHVRNIELEEFEPAAFEMYHGQQKAFEESNRVSYLSIPVAPPRRLDSNGAASIIFLWKIAAAVSDDSWVAGDAAVRAELRDGAGHVAGEDI